MMDYQKYINALRKCAKEHEKDTTFTGHIIVSDLCRDTANLLEELEQEPCEDCISRQAVWDVMQELWGTSGELLDRLMALPSVIPQQRTGRWIEERTYMKCPNCHDIWHYEENQTERFKYCPNCGSYNGDGNNGNE